MTRPAPHILLITDDQHRWDWLGWTGVVPALRTPHLDQLRTSGLAFTNAWSNCPVCIPTRFSWYSGLHASQGRAALLSNSTGWPDHVPYVPQILQAHGYHTAAIGKLHHADGPEPRRDHAAPGYVAKAKARGFDTVWEVGGRSQAFFHDCQWTHHLRRHGLLDRYLVDIADRRADRCWNEPYRPSVLPAEHHADALIADQTVAWLEQVGEDRPFFLHASFCAPHFPLDPPPDWFARVRPADMPPPCGVSDPVELAYWQEQRAAYACLIEFVDHQIGRVLDALRRRGLTDRTVVIFTSDHGDRLGDQHSWHKSQPQDGSCRVPLMVRLPGTVPSGGTHAGFVGAVDLAPTLLEVAGVPGPVSFHLPESPGRSFWTQAQDPGAAPVRQTIYAEHVSFRMVVDQDWKYVLGSDGTERLFHRVTDPDDLDDRAGRPELADVLADRRLALLRETQVCLAPNRPGYWQERARRPHRPRPERIPMRPSGGGHQGASGPGTPGGGDAT
jgi:arylsulfatase A-like enzyme